MSSTSTTWSTDGLTKASNSTSTDDNLTVGSLQLNNNIIKASDGGSTITLDTSDNVTIAGDLTVTGNNITFGNGESVYNTVDNKIGLTTNASGEGTFEVLSAGATNLLVKSATADARISLVDGASTKWTIGYDYNDSGKLKIDTGGTVGGATKITLDTSGNLTVAGTITAGTQPNWTVTNKTGTSRALDCDGDVGAIGDRLGQLIDDLISVGILT